MDMVRRLLIHRSEQQWPRFENEYAPNAAGDPSGYHSCGLAWTLSADSTPVRYAAERISNDPHNFWRSCQLFSLGPLDVGSES